MTDAEIIKALKCCSKPYCNNNTCPLHRNTINTKDYITQLSTNALDLINRQKAEIENLREDNEILKNYVKFAKSEEIKEFAKRLKANNVRFCCECGERINTTPLIGALIDNLVKEMAGEAE